MVLSSIEVFKALRIYRKLPLSMIFNQILCNRSMKLNFLVNNASTIYNVSCKLLSKNFINYILNLTFCKTLTAGNTIEEADGISNYFRQEKIAVILDYCAEGDLAHLQQESELDANAAMFARSADHIKTQQNQMISIKITGLLDVVLLKKVSNAVLHRNNFWKENSVNGVMTFQQLLSGLHKIYSGITEEQAETYIKQIHRFQGSTNEFSIQEVDFKMNHYPYYLYQPNKNTNFVIKLFFPTDQGQTQKLNNFQRRLLEICQPFCQNQTNFKILVDAEQSYFQRGIESFSEQLQERYNKTKLFIIPTIQNYLKESYERSLYEIAIAKRKNLVFGAKLVRGAYIVEETKLANKFKYESPIVECFEKTTQNYIKTFEAMVKNFEKGEIIVATHNQDTILQTLEIKNKYSKSPEVSFAQLIGLADHLTFYVNAKGYRVYKYLPWGKTDIMIAYMIRRAEELNQMRYPLTTQYQLLTHELKCRLIG